MEDSIVNLLFTEDLVKFILKHHGIDWNSEIGLENFRNENRKSPFQNEMALGVVFIWEKCNIHIVDCFKELQAIPVLERKQFGYYALKAAHLYFENGYSHGSFLGYCAMLIGVVYNYHPLPSNDIPGCASEILALVLTAFQLTGEFNRCGGWDGLFQVSKRLLSTFFEGKTD